MTPTNPTAPDALSLTAIAACSAGLLGLHRLTTALSKPQTLDVSASPDALAAMVAAFPVIVAVGYFVAGLLIGMFAPNPEPTATWSAASAIALATMGAEFCGIATALAAILLARAGATVARRCFDERRWTRTHRGGSYVPAR